MTKLLEKAFQEAAKLPAAEQNALAHRLLTELTGERRWDRLFDVQPDRLHKRDLGEARSA